MTPAARVQAAIEILGEVTEAARDAGPSADVLIAKYFRTRRYAGSKDRRAIRELVYEVIRTVGERPESGRAALLGARPELEEHFTGLDHAPAPVQPGEQRAEPGLAPAWLLERLGERAQPELLERASIDLRVNRLKTDPAACSHLGVPVEGLPNALTGAPDDISRREEYRDGLVELQDLGSQHVVQMCGAQPGMTVLDLCAGAGGKSLALAADMQNRGRLVATDTDRRRLDLLRPRAERAGAQIVERRLLDPGKEAGALTDLEDGCDVVLVDAPCSGTGTWRRNPEARWRLTPARLERLVELQRRLLGLASRHVRPGGALVYAVCSLLPEEGEGAADNFAYPDYTETARRLLTPGRDGCDGFFIARFEKA